ncbi:MAG: hypothetical protein QNJ37_19620 [Crocosphaera sp.]|nr:hypothetical protein [Crocosphaera sp.]
MSDSNKFKFLGFELSPTILSILSWNIILKLIDPVLIREPIPTQMAWGFTIVVMTNFLFVCLKAIINEPKNIEIKYKSSKFSVIRIFKNELENKNIKTIYLLLIALNIYAVIGTFWEKLEISSYFLLGGLTFASLLYLNTFLVKFRIKKGFYGGNEFEAREIINFIEENSENIDFGNGDSPKNLFNEEDLKEMEESIIELNNGLPQPNI